MQHTQRKMHAITANSVDILLFMPLDYVLSLQGHSDRRGVPTTATWLLSRQYAIISI